MNGVQGVCDWERQKLFKKNDLREPRALQLIDQQAQRTRPVLRPLQPRTQRVPHARVHGRIRFALHRQAQEAQHRVENFLLLRRLGVRVGRCGDAAHAQQELRAPRGRPSNCFDGGRQGA